MNAIEFEMSVVKKQIANIETSIQETKQEKREVLNKISDEEIDDKKRIEEETKAKKSCGKKGQKKRQSHPYARK